MASSVEDKVKHIIVEQLGVDEDEVKSEASFVDDLGADSLDVVELVMALEEEFGLEISDEDAEKIGNVQQAIDYMLANTAESRDDVISEVDRYIAVPGQATSYMLGNLEIRALREQAQQQMGANFDLRAFHDKVLEDGAVPLSLLHEKMQRWIATPSH